MTIVARIDEHACSAHGDCADLAPDVFRVDEVAVVIGSAPPELLLEVAQGCPAVAISVADDENGVVLYP
jgi:ferredoxin